MRVRALLAVTALALATGCVSSSDVERLQAQVFDLQDQVAQLKRSSSTEVQQVNQKMARQTEDLLKSYADLTARVGEGDEKMQSTVGQIEQTNYRLDRIAQQLTQLQSELAAMKASRGTIATAPVSEIPPPAGGTPAGGTVIVDSEPSDDPIEVYQSAYRDYQRGNYDLARQGFDDFVKANPQSDLADNAMYWIGETYFAQKKHRDAIAMFDRVINEYPKSDKVPSALLKKGLAYIEMGEKAQGVVQLQYVIHEHPGSREATLARQRLQAMGIETR
ncbi:MAG: tol-pal system protein YbgF [Thermoanaerobaculia bacterium]|nr:tol-pal system protein YbgF [Thermoanaerobaculia bacterium]